MKRFICFVHIEKAGGITLHNIFHTIFNNYLTPSPAFGEHFTKSELQKLIKIWPLTIAGIGGHRLGAFLNYEEVLTKDIFYLTFLREPIARYMSHMNWQKNIMNINWSPASFTAETYFNNFQCYRISGERSFISAKQVISKKFGFVGLMEEYDPSLVILSYLLGLDMSAFQYSKANQKKYGIKEFKFEKLSDELQSHIIENNHEDIKLYYYLKDELFPDFKNSIDNLHDKVARFQRRNRHYHTPLFPLLKRKTTNLLLSKVIQPYLTIKPKSIEGTS